MFRLALLALAAALVLTSCGGESTSGDTTTAATTATSSPNDRLSAAQWADYEAARTKARTVNEAAIKTFQKCRKLLDSTPTADQMNACLGSSTDDVVAAGRTAMASVESLAGASGGECATANAALSGNINLYIASVQSLGNTIDMGSIPGMQSALNSSLTALTASRAAGAKFEEACKPLA